MELYNFMIVLQKEKNETKGGRQQGKNLTELKKKSKYGYGYYI